MQFNADTLFEAALKLTESDRFTLVSKLMETMPDENFTTSLEDKDLVAELDRRFGDPEGSVAWSELKAEG